MRTLYIANKNYSSWSLRPWVLMRELGLPFEERLVPFVPGPSGSSVEAYKRFSPTGKVPCLVDDETVVWDSLGIIGHLAEEEPRVWPADRAARTWARCAAAEMHSGYAALRAHCTFNCGVRIRLDAIPEALQQDLTRLDELWTDGLSRFGGPFLAGAAFTAADAFFAPIAFRMQTYGLELGPAAMGYAARLRALPAMQDWEAAALKETWRDPSHEAEAAKAGTWLEDLRAPAG